MLRIRLEFKTKKKLGSSEHFIMAAMSMTRFTHVNFSTKRCCLILFFLLYICQSCASYKLSNIQSNRAETRDDDVTTSSSITSHVVDTEHSDASEQSRSADILVVRPSELHSQPRRVRHKSLRRWLNRHHHQVHISGKTLRKPCLTMFDVGNLGIFDQEIKRHFEILFSSKLFSKAHFQVNLYSGKTITLARID